ncbi:hypothetical protein QBC45DRAFT_464669 [Copromyces sp. CBS 386.78]|nr:hypothetical protein QBC45DRAFT_464669 [Copromyces sp. CBS 386.78]
MNNLNTDHQLKSFVPRMEQAAAQHNPYLVNYWQIILAIQENLKQPASAEFGGVEVIKSWEEIKRMAQWNDQHDRFSRSAYEYLRFAYDLGASEQAIKRIAHTKPYIREEALAGMNAHELALSRKISKGNQEEDQTYECRMRSEAEHWVHDKIVCDYTKKRVPQSARLDIPIFAYDEAVYVKEMVEAMTNMVGPKDGNAAQIDTVKKMSKGVVEHVAWHLFRESRYAQNGDAQVQPWCTGFYLREYDTWQERWDDMIALMTKSKAAVADLIITTYVKRFANDPCYELQRKEANDRNNKERARKAREQAAVAGQAPGAGGANH